MMNIWALEGHKVKVTEASARCGYDGDKDQVKRHLELNKEYTVAYTDVGSSYSNVILKEFPRERFNTANFEDVTEQSDEEDQRHEQWNFYNGED